VVNNDRNNKHEVKITVNGRVKSIDLLTGAPAYIPTRDNILSDMLGPCDSRLYYLEEKEVGSGEKLDVSGSFYTSFSPVCKVRRNMPNVLTLDKCRWNFEGEEKSEGMEVWKAQYQIRDILGMRQVHLNGGEQRYRWIHSPHCNDGRRVTFEFSFQSEYTIEQVDVLIERAVDYTIKLNNQPVASVSDGWYLDKSFDKVRLPEINVGKNILTLTCAYKNSMEVEDIYLLGDFAVSIDRILVPETGRVCVGDWTKQGYLHYAGSLAYLYELDWNVKRGQEVELRIPDFVATTVCVKVNSHVFNIPWKAVSSVRITHCLQEGQNEIEVEVISSPRNMLGPFHLAEGKPENTHDESFRASGIRAIEGYNVHPYGLYSPPKLYTSDRN
jgi:hypothetical protein